MRNEVDGNDCSLDIRRRRYAADSPQRVTDFLYLKPAALCV